MVKDNEETNVKLLLCVHIGVSLNATLVFCLDMSSKTNQPTNHENSKQTHKKTPKPQTTKKSPKTEYFTQANKLFGIPEDDKNKTKKATKKKTPPQYQGQYYYLNMCNRLLKKSHGYYPFFSLHQAKESPRHYGQDNISYLTSSLPTETRWGYFQLHWLSFFRPSSIQKSQERFSDNFS